MSGGVRPAAGSTLGSKSQATSPDHQARAVINWITTTLPRDAEKGYAAGTLPLSALLADAYRPFGARTGVPSIVYFFTAKDDDKLVKFDASVFGDERVGVSSRFFNCLKISLDHMSSDAERKLYGGAEPMVVVLDDEGREVKRVGGWDLTGSRILKLMEVAFKDRYGIQLSAFLAKESRVLETLDRVYWELKDLETEMTAARDHLAKHDCDRGRRLVKELEGDIAKQEAEKAKALEEEKKLLEASAAGGSKP